MPFGGGGLAVLGAATALPKLIAGITQGVKASKVKLQDSTPLSFREKLAMDRQAASSGQLPGLGVQQNRLAMVQAGALKNAQLGAASGSDFLAAASAADGRRQAGRDEQGTLVHPGFAQDAGVDEQDVGHGQEGGDPGEDFRAHGGVVRLELEE